MCVLQRIFSFQCESLHFSTVPISFMFQKMKISSLPTVTWGKAPALHFNMPGGDNTSGSSPASVTSSGSRSSWCLAHPCLLPVCCFLNVLFSPRPRPLGKNRSYLCCKYISATSTTFLLLRQSRDTKGKECGPSQRLKMQVPCHSQGYRTSSSTQHSWGPSLDLRCSSGGEWEFHFKDSEARASLQRRGGIHLIKVHRGVGLLPTGRTRHLLSLWGNNRWKRCSWRKTVRLCVSLTIKCISHNLHCLGTVQQILYPQSCCWLHKNQGNSFWPYKHMLGLPLALFLITICPKWLILFC